MLNVTIYVIFMIKYTCKKEETVLNSSIKSLFIQGYYGWKVILNILIYIAFFAYVLYLIIEAPKFSTKILYLFILVIVLGTCLYYEYLKQLYHRMVGLLINDCDPIKAWQSANLLTKRDIFKGFKGSLKIFNVLLLMDEGHYEECRRYLTNEDQFFRASIDNIFIKYHSELQLAWLLNDPELGNSAMKGLNKIRNTNRKKYSPLFSWDEIDGLHCYINDRYSKALTYLNHVDISKLNSREQTYLNVLIADTYRKAGKTNEIGSHLQTAKELGNKLAIINH